MTSNEPLPPHRAERARLCELFDQLGPDAPTLCEGWATADLAAHLVLREAYNPLPPLGIVVPPLHRLHDDAIVRTKARLGFPGMVDRIRHGPPPGPMRLLDGLVNVQEYFVHHEDARRGGGDHTPRPADEIADVEAALWRNLRRGARFMTRSVRDVGLELRRPDGAAITARATPAGRPTAVLVGRAGEIVLYLLGRRAAADVRIEGGDDAEQALAEARLGL